MQVAEKVYHNRETEEEKEQRKRKGEGEDERETQSMDILHLVQSSPRRSRYKKTVHIYK